MSDHQKRIISIQRDSNLSSAGTTKKSIDAIVHINQSKTQLITNKTTNIDNNIFSNLTTTNIVYNLPRSYRTLEAITRNV